MDFLDIDQSRSERSLSAFLQFAVVGTPNNQRAAPEAFWAAL